MSPGAEIVARHWLISGRVQGVGYRLWLRREAQALGVEGWVRNLGDGRVEAVLRGGAVALDRLQAAAHGGPPLAVVDAVEARPWRGSVPQGRFSQSATADMPAADD